MEYSDPNGEVLAVATRVPLHPVRRLSSASSPKAGPRTGKRCARRSSRSIRRASRSRTARSSVDVYERKSYSNRRRLVGGFYAYDTTTETKRDRLGCSGTTDARGLMFCTVKPQGLGRTDPASRARRTTAGAKRSRRRACGCTATTTGGSSRPNHDRIDLIAEKKRYEPGETAKFQVRMPFREATVLVTVEREGVLSQKVVEHRRQVAGDRSADARQLRSERVRLRARAARARRSRSAGPVRVAEALGLQDRLLARHRRRSADRARHAAHRARRSRQARLQARHDRDQGRAPRLHAQRQGDARARRAQGARHGAGRDRSRGQPTASPRRTARSRSRPSTKGCSSSWTTRRGTSSTRCSASARPKWRPRPRRGWSSASATSARKRSRRAAAADAAARASSSTRCSCGKAACRSTRRAARPSTIPLNDSLTSFRIVAVAHAGAAKFGHGAADGAHHAGPDAVLGPAAGRARAGRIQRDVHGEERDRAAARREVHVDRARPARRRQGGDDARERRAGGRARRRAKRKSSRCR